MAPGTDECDHELPVRATRRKSAAERMYGKPFNVDDVEAGAEQLFEDGELIWEAHDGRGLEDGLLRWNLAHVEVVYAA